jgi:DNA polymerase/3'-5' exonuclease PolX
MRIQTLHKYKGEVYKAAAYTHAITQLKMLPLSKVKVGVGIGKKIAEFQRTGDIVSANVVDDIRAFKELSGILGAGPSAVSQWMDMGIKSLVQLRRAIAKKQVKLTTMQQYGLLYYYDLSQKIPRATVAKISGVIFKVIRNLCVKCKMETVGSYRRGAEMSGDIDIITTQEYAMKELEKNLMRLPVYITTLSIGKERYSFLIQDTDANLARQVDILRLKQYYTGILYFTGSWEFNAAMRGYAKSHGYRLNQQGLTRVAKATTAPKVKASKPSAANTAKANTAKANTAKANTAKATTAKPSVAKPIKVKSEADVFKILGLRYIEPRMRVDEKQIIPLE